MTVLEKIIVSVFKDTLPEVTDFVNEDELIHYDKIELQALSYYTDELNNYLENEELILNPFAIYSTIGKLEMCYALFENDLYKHLEMYYFEWLRTLAEFEED